MLWEISSCVLCFLFLSQLVEITWAFLLVSQPHIIWNNRYQCVSVCRVWLFSLRGSVCITKYIPSRRNGGMERYYSRTKYSKFEFMSTLGELRSMYNFVSAGCYDVTISFWSNKFKARLTFNIHASASQVLFH